MDGSQHYSPLATPTRSSFRRQGRSSLNNASVRFQEDIDHAAGLGSLKGRNPVEVKQEIFKKYFDPFAAYNLTPASPTRSGRASTRNVHSAPGTPVSRAGEPTYSDGPWTHASTVRTLPRSDWNSPKPRWTLARQPAFQNLTPDDPRYSNSLFHAVTRPVTTGGNLARHLEALDKLLIKAWTRQEVAQAQAFGFFRRLVPQLGVPQLQCGVALLLARCARLAPALLPPLTQSLCAVLPVLLGSPRAAVRQAGLCLLGLLWSATATSHPQVRGLILEAPKLLGALGGAAAAGGDPDVLWAMRELAADERGAAALERSGALQPLCAALGRLAADASAGGDGGGGGGDGSGDCVDGGGEASAAAGTRDGDGGEAKGRNGASTRTGRQQQQHAASSGVAGPAQSPARPQVPPGGASRASPPLTKGTPGAAVLGQDAADEEGVTEGGAEVERTARAVLLADCLAAFTVSQSATTAMCKRYRVPERLVTLLLRVPPPTALTGQPRTAGPGSEAADAVPPSGASGTGEGAEAGSGPGGTEAAQGSSGDGALATVPPASPSSEATSDLYADDWEHEGGRSTAMSPAAPGVEPGPGSAGAGGAEGGDGAASSTAAAEEAMKEAPAEEAASAASASDPDSGSLSREQRCRLQQQEALLRCLYSLASCGLGREPQEAVQRALRDAGPAALERLSKVLQDRMCLGGCSAAAYLLWLAAAGDYSSAPSSELNVIRDRLAAPAPAATSGAQAGRPGGSGGGGGGAGGSSGGSSGLGVVAAVSEVLLVRLTEWKDTDPGDCVPDVRTAAPPPPPPPPPAASGADVLMPTGVPGPKDGAQRQLSLPRLESLRSRGDAGGGREAGAGGMFASEAGPHGRAGGASDGAGYDGVDGAGGAAGAHNGGREDDAGRARLAEGWSRLRVGSASVLLTPRQSRPGSALATTPQRYEAASSDDEDERGRDGAVATNVTSGDEGSGSGGGADPLGGTVETQDMDMSNIIDSSVELTGKEQIMQAIQEAALAVAQGDADGKAADQAEGPASNVIMPPHEVPSGAGPPSGNGRGPIPDPAYPGAPTDASADDHTRLTSSGQVVTVPTWPPVDRARATADAATQSPSIAWSANGAPGNATAGPTPPRPLSAFRPSPLVLSTTTASPVRPETPPEAPPRLSLEARLSAVRYIRTRWPPPAVPPPVEVQALLCNSVGLLAAVALSAGGAKAILASPGLLSHAASLLGVPTDTPESPAAAAVSSSGLELRLQLLALLANLSLHSEGASAVAAAAAAGGGPSLPAALFATASHSCQLLGRNPSSWRAGQQLLEACFTVLTNLHRAHSAVSVPSEGLGGGGGPTDSYSLAMEALKLPLPGPMGRSDRFQFRAAAARMLDSSISAYEGIGQALPPAAVSELIALLELGGSASAAAAAGIGAEAAERAATDGAGALWQVMAAGQVHPDSLLPGLQGPLSAVLRRRDAGTELSRRCLGLVSCLARSVLACRRMWATPLVPGVLAVHARAKAAGEGEVERVAVEVCQQLCRACHREDRGGVSNTDKQVDRFRLTESMLAQLGCRLEYDSGEEAVMLVPREEE